MPNPTPPIPAGVPIIGQPMFMYKLGHAQLGLPVAPEQALANFGAYQQQGGQLDPAWVLMWIAATIEAAQLRTALVQLHNRVLELEARAGVVTREQAAIDHVPIEGEDPQPERDDALPQWAKKAAAAAGSSNAVLDGLCAEEIADRTCRVCGCTDDDCSQCIAKTGEPCRWAEPDLCTACLAEILLRDEGDVEAAELELGDDEEGAA